MPEGFELFRLWWADVPRRLGEATCRNYRREVFATFAVLGKHPESVTTRQLQAHLGTLRPQHASLRRAALVEFFSWLERQGLRPDNPLAETHGRPVKVNGYRRAWSEEQLWRAVFAALVLGEHGRKENGDRLAWAMLAQYGLCLRPGEILKLSKAEVNLNGVSSSVYIKETKTGYDRAIPVIGVAREALEHLIEIAGPSASRLIPWGTSYYWERVKAAAISAGIPGPKAVPYALRHTGATHLAERGVQPRIIAQIMGHRDLRHALVYTQPTSEEMRAALAKLG